MPFVFKEVNGLGFYEVTGWNGARGIFTARPLNMGSGGGDDPAVAANNRGILAEALGVSVGMVKTVNQVHGTDVFVLREPDAGRPAAGYDALITGLPGAALGVLTADCVPILLYDPVSRVVGAVHAGWAGTVKGIAGRAVREMVKAYGSNPGDIVAAIGPSIGPCCYEVDERVMAPLRETLDGLWMDLAAPSGPGHWMLDLWKANRRVLLLSGLNPDKVETAGLCTGCNQDRFFSYRKGGSAGRMMGVVAMVNSIG